MDRKTLALGIALAYPEYAFSAEDPLAIERGRALVERAGRGETVTSEVRQILNRNPRLNEWVEQLLEDRDLVPPHLQLDEVRAFDPLPGKQRPVKAPRFVCPTGDGFTWYQTSVGEITPPCPFCGSALELA